MNRYDFTQPGGFPFDQGVMAFIQDCITTASKSATLAGPLAILSGCEVAGDSAGAGFVVINGEVLPFSAGLIEATVIIVETGTVIAYEDGTPRTTKFERVARFGSAGGIGEYAWADFKRNTTEGILARIERLEGLSRPFMAAGGMVWWKGAIADIPTGWREVVAWRGKLPMPAKAPVENVRPAGFDIGNEGGAETHLLTIDEIPAHTHALDEELVGSGTGGKVADAHGAGTDPYAGGLGTGSTGGGLAHSILNPYKVGCWIEPIPGTF
jgi:hypothetical protein